MVKSRAEAEAKFLAGIKASAEATATKLQSLSKLPTISAAEAKAKWLTNVSASQSKWETALRGVTTAQYNEAVRLGFDRIQYFELGDVSKFGDFIDRLGQLYAHESAITTQVVTKANATYLTLDATANSRVIRILVNLVIMAALAKNITNVTSSAFTGVRDAVLLANFS